MPSALDKQLARLDIEGQQASVVGTCFVYLAAISESGLTKRKSSLFEAVPHLPTVQPTKAVLRQIKAALLKFIDDWNCAWHPNMDTAFRIIAEIDGKRRRKFFREKLSLFYQQGNARVCYQLCLILEDLGEDVWRDEKMRFIGSRSSQDSLVNLGVTKRYLERLYENRRPIQRRR